MNCSVDLASRMIVERGENSWKLWLFQFVDDFRRTQNPELIDQPPASDLPLNLRSLTASTVEALCAECQVAIPDWCRDVPPLEHPWFVSGIENLKAMALVETPAQFRQRNIFVLGNFPDRA